MLTVRPSHSHTKSTNADLRVCGVSPSSSTTATATPTTANVVAFAPPAPRNPRNHQANDASANSTPSHLYAPSRNGGPEQRSLLSRRMMNAISLHGVPPLHNTQGKREGGSNDTVQYASTPSCEATKSAT